MIIKEITIENFRSYYGINTIKFNEGLVIFIGDNGDGKTTFFEVLEWLFDTSGKHNLDYRLISEKKKSELSEFESHILRVSMTFEHDGEKIVEKSFSFNKNVNNEIKISDYQFKGFENHGSERYLLDGAVLLDRCFNAYIRKYCLFKGEENLNVFNGKDTLNYLIETFSNISEFEPYFKGGKDNQGFTEYAASQSEAAFKRAMLSDKNNSQQEKELSLKLTSSLNRLSDLKQRLKSNRENANNYSNKLDEIEKNKEASEVLRDINERIKSFKEKKSKIETLINEDYSINLLDDMWILCNSSEIFEEFQQKISLFSKEKRKLEREDDKQKGKSELASEIAVGIIPLSPNIPGKVSMQEMIKDEFCKVCGREAKKGTDEYNFMVKKLDDLIQSQLPKEKDVDKLFPNNILKDLEQKSNSLEYNIPEINGLFNTIREKIEFNEARKEDVKKIQENIDNEEEKKKKLLAQSEGLTEEQLQNAFENINNWWDYKNQAEKQIVLLELEETELENEIEKYKELYNNLAKGSVAETSKKIHDALERIMNAFKNAKVKNTNDFLFLLEEKANQYLKNLNIDGFFGILRIIKTHDDNAKIIFEDRNGIFLSNPNQALKTTMYMSVLFAVSDLTALKRENDYPLIFDAPTSSFSPQKESDFFNIISQVRKQCIIFTKSFLTEQGTLDNNKIEALNCKIYRIEKQRPFDSLDISTIQTKITLIKD
jgi:DNA sulfur modification protein DndD